MQPTSRIDAADRLSRKRAIGAAVAALVFVAIQLIAPPFFVDKRESLRDSQALLWLVTLRNTSAICREISRLRHFVMQIAYGTRPTRTLRCGTPSISRPGRTTR